MRPSACGRHHRNSSGSDVRHHRARQSSIHAVFRRGFACGGRCAGWEGSMRSIRNLRSLPAGRSLLAEDLLEFHAARLLLLMRYCGAANRIDGLTKLAKLDFFVRYPAFFASACEALGKEAPPDALGGVEAPMVRHHYGPWDKRYYHVLAFLEGAGLVTVTTARGAGAVSYTHLTLPTNSEV